MKRDMLGMAEYLIWIFSAFIIVFIGAMVGRELSSWTTLPLWDVIVADVIVGVISFYWAVVLLKGARKRFNK